MSKSNLTNSFKVLSATCLLAISSVSQAAITAISDDFEGYGTAGVPSVPDFFPWSGFSDNCGFPGGYAFLPSTTGPGISALGWNGTDNQYLNFFAQYENANCHTGIGPNPQEAISVYRDMPFTAADTANGDTWVFSFEFREADIPPAGATEVGAYIRVFDPIRNILQEVAIDTSGSANWRQGILSVTLDPAWTSGFFQVGFNNLVGNYEDSGMFYDEVSLAKAQDPLVEIEGGGSNNKLHIHHRGQGGLPDDQIPVVVYGSSTLVGDPVDLDSLDVITSTVTFGPGNAPRVVGQTQTEDFDSDGLVDRRYRFLTSAVDFPTFQPGPSGDKSCTDSAATLTGETATGAVFAGSDNFTADCEASCHVAPFP